MQEQPATRQVRTLKTAQQGRPQTFHQQAFFDSGGRCGFSQDLLGPRGAQFACGQPFQHGRQAGCRPWLGELGLGLLVGAGGDKEGRRLLHPIDQAGQGGTEQGA